MVDALSGSLGLCACLLGFAVFSAPKGPRASSRGEDLGALPPVVELEVHEGSNTVHVASPRPILIGRASNASVKLEDRTASRLHARIERRGETVVVEDLGSRNGTLLNGKQLSGEAFLEVGDRVRIGSAEIVFLGVEGWK